MYANTTVHGITGARPASAQIHGGTPYVSMTFLDDNGIALEISLFLKNADAAAPVGKALIAAGKELLARCGKLRELVQSEAPA